MTIQSPLDLTRFLTRAQGTIAAALPKHLNPDRMVRLAVTCFSTTPKLRECSPNSILASLIVASQLGLEPGIGGQGYLIPYKTTCTFVPGWQGLVGLLNNTGRATVWTGSVFEGDTWEFELGSNPKCRHIPGENFGDASKLIWVYACGKINGSEQPVMEAWPMARVWKHRDKFNKVGNAHYSFQHPEMYARKVVLLQVLKYMPRSIELQNAMELSNRDLGGRGATINEEGVIVDVESSNVEQTQAKIPDKEKKGPAKVDPAPVVQSSDPTPSLREELQMFIESEGITLAQVEKVLRDAKLYKNAGPLADLKDLDDRCVDAIMKDTALFAATAAQ